MGNSVQGRGRDWRVSGIMTKEPSARLIAEKQRGMRGFRLIRWAAFFVGIVALLMIVGFLGGLWIAYW
jgi:hypothetical protein